MEVTKLIVSIIICLCLMVIGGGLLGTTVWLTLKVKFVIDSIDALTELFGKVIDGEAAISANAERMANAAEIHGRAVAEFKTTLSDDLKAVKASEEALLRIVARNILAVEGLAKVVQKFSQDLLDASAGSGKKNYDVAPENEGLTQEQIEKRQVDEILRATEEVKRVYKNPLPNIIATEEK